MTYTQSSGGAQRESSSAPSSRGWTGLLAFAAFMMLMLGFFQAIQGLAAIVNEDFYKVGADGLALAADFTVWGWVHLALGVAIFLAGVGVMTGNILARAVGVVLAGSSALLNMVFAAAQPLWSVIVIIIDVFVIYALILHGRDWQR